MCYGGTHDLECEHPNQNKDKKNDHDGEYAAGDLPCIAGTVLGLGGVTCRGSRFMTETKFQLS